MQIIWVLDRWSDKLVSEMISKLASNSKFRVLRDQNKVDPSCYQAFHHKGVDACRVQPSQQGSIY
jgi:hypothetical protein